MIKIYDAIEKVATLKGGSSLPWKVNVKTNEGVKPYVVKLFTTSNLEQAGSIAKEYIGNILAKELDLYCPEPALVRFSNAFKSTLGAEDQEILRNKDNGLKFACEFVEGAIPFNKYTPRSILYKYHVGKIFAFDNIILNMDRNNAKPNILLKRRECYLIDHEMALEITQVALNNLQRGGTYYEYHKHIFYRFLLRCSNDDKTEFCNEFEETFRSININNIISAMDDLLENNQNVKDYELLYDYLNKAKSEIGQFCSRLKFFLSPNQP